MYKNLYYNNKSNMISLWENDEKTNKTKFSRHDYMHDYYVTCPDGQTPDARDIYGRPLKKRTAKYREALDKLRQIGRLANGFYSAESDLDPEVKFLQERYAGKHLKNDMNAWNVCFMDIEIAAEAEFPRPEVAERPINLITVKSSKTQKITTFGLKLYTGDSDLIDDYMAFATEEDLLIKFVNWFRHEHFDIITGWNVKHFDIHYIINRIRNILPDTGLESRLSPLNKILVKRATKLTGACYELAGLAILDYMELYKNFTFKTQPSYTLQAIGMAVCKKGKLDLDGSINSIYKTDWNRFVDYNVQDVILVDDIDNELQFINLAITFAYDALIPVHRVFSSIATIEGYMLKKMHEKGLRMPDRQTDVHDWWFDEELYNKKLPNGKIEKQNWKEELTPSITEFYCKGGHVEANPGLYKHVLSYDITSLYPFMIIQYNISPETKFIKPTKEEIIKYHLIESELNGVYYKPEKGILPEIIQSIFDERKAFKDKMFTFKKGTNDYGFYDRQQHVRKILINSMYGVMINKYFHFYDIDNARAITRGGRVLIRHMSVQTNDYMQNYFHQVSKSIFPGIRPKQLKENLVSVIDTDSNYVQLDEVKRHYAPTMPPMEFFDIMDPFLQKFYDHVLQIKADAKGLKQVIGFKREGKILKQFVQAKKKYIVELMQKEKDVFDPPIIDYTGIEVKRSSTPIFVREHIEEAVKDIFDNLDKNKNHKLIKRVWKDFQKQDIDDIATVGSVKEYTKYAAPTKTYLNKGVNFVSGTPMRNKAAICYNYMIMKNGYPLMPIANGSKIKYIRVNTNNPTHNDAIAWVGNWPKEFSKDFKIEYQEHFNKEFLGVLSRMWVVLGWTDSKTGIELRKSKLGGFFE